MNQLSESTVSMLRCPTTGQSLRLLAIADAETQIGTPLVSLRLCKDGEEVKAPPFGPTPQVLLREDAELAYPVVDGIPILLAPEALGPQSKQRDFDLRQARYDEAYSEMQFYNEMASEQAERVEELECFDLLRPLMNLSEEASLAFPAPRADWLDAVYDSASQNDAYEHLAPIANQRLLQLGGQGYHAVKFLLGGASEAWAITPMLGELRLARALARAVGVEDRLRCVVSIAEELALGSDTFDGIYSGGCVHHMVTDLAMDEASRVLKQGGRFAAVDPWKTPFHDVGTKLFGKREAVHCRPLTTQRVAPMFEAFNEAEVVHHGAVSRHLLLALHKLGLRSPLAVADRIGSFDDAVASVVPGMRGLGSSVALLATKSPTDSANAA